MKETLDFDSLEKLYYSIGEVSKLLDINASNIRYWEKEFSKLKPKKDKNGNRKFTVDDIKLINAIHGMVKERGLTLDGARKKLNAEGIGAVKREHEALEKLSYVKSELQKILRTMKSEA
jgi:DNA-binding transcriptional MerR regulator